LKVCLYFVALSVGILLPPSAASSCAIAVRRCDQDSDPRVYLGACNDDVVATKVAGVDAPLGMDVTAPLAFTVIVVDTSRRLASKVR